MFDRVILKTSKIRHIVDKLALLHYVFILILEHIIKYPVVQRGELVLYMIDIFSLKREENAIVPSFDATCALQPRQKGNFTEDVSTFEYVYGFSLRSPFDCLFVEVLINKLVVRFPHWLLILRLYLIMRFVKLLSYG